MSMVEDWNKAKCIGESIGDSYLSRREFFTQYLKNENPLNIPLLPIQQASVSNIAALGHGHIWDDMGLGKTAQALAIGVLLEESPVLIFCPNNIKAVWKQEILKFTDTSEKQIFTGGGVDLISLTPTLTRKYRYLIFNYEALMVAIKSLKDKIPKVIETCRYHILDEAHNMRNADTYRCIAYLTYIENTSPHVVTLSGTPIDRCINELWPYLAMSAYSHPGTFMDFVGYYPNLASFSDRYAIAKVVHGDGNDIYRSYNKQMFHEIPNIIGMRAVRREISDVVEMPPLKDENIFIPDHLFQIDMQQACKDFARAFAMIHSVVKNENAYNKGDMAKLGNVFLARVQKMRVALAMEKLEFTEKTLLANIKQGHKCIVFSEFRMPVYELSEKLQKLEIPSVVVTGDLKSFERDEQLKQFKNGDVDILIGTYGSLSEGENLQICTNMILNDISWQPLVMKQAKRRIWRIGQSKPCEIYTMLCNADKTVYDVVVGKWQMVDALNYELKKLRGIYAF